jgi:hypothetical protein
MIRVCLVGQNKQEELGRGRRPEVKKASKKFAHQTFIRINNRLALVGGQ